MLLDCKGIKNNEIGCVIVIYICVHVKLKKAFKAVSCSLDKP